MSAARLERISLELAHMETIPVYFAQAKRSGAIKIGFSSEVYNRLYLLSHHEHTPVTLLGWVLGGPRVEREMHARFSAFARGHEWFDPAPELLAFIESSTEHGDCEHVSKPYGRITDWGYDSLLRSRRLLEMAQAA